MIVKTQYWDYPVVQRLRIHLPMQKIQAGSLVGELGPYMSRATKQQLRLDAAKYIIFFQLKKKKRLSAWESWAGQNMSHLDYLLGFFFSVWKAVEC